MIKLNSFMMALVIMLVAGGWQVQAEEAKATPTAADTAENARKRMPPEIASLFKAQEDAMKKISEDARNSQTEHLKSIHEINSKISEANRNGNETEVQSLRKQRDAITDQLRSESKAMRARVKQERKDWQEKIKAASDKLREQKRQAAAAEREARKKAAAPKAG